MKGGRTDVSKTSPKAGYGAASRSDFGFERSGPPLRLPRKSTAQVSLTILLEPLFRLDRVNSTAPEQKDEKISLLFARLRLQEASDPNLPKRSVWPERSCSESARHTCPKPLRLERLLPREQW